MSVETYLRKISEEAGKVDTLARLIDAECKFCYACQFHGPYSQLQVQRKIAMFMHGGFVRLNDRLDGL
jgi:hypothetical protein